MRHSQFDSVHQKEPFLWRRTKTEFSQWLKLGKICFSRREHDTTEVLPFKHNGYKHKRKVAGHKGLNIKQLRRLQDTTLTINDLEGRARRL